jgi:broad specificity phosphatase PhoE
MYESLLRSREIRPANGVHPPDLMSSSCTRTPTQGSRQKRDSSTSLSNFVKEHYWDDYIHWLAEPAWNPPTGGETSVEISSRASLVIAEIQEKYATGDVLVVSHKATIRIIVCSLLGIDLGRYRDRIEMLAGSVSIIRFDVHGPLLEVLGDRAYMGEELRTRPGD